MRIRVANETLQIRDADGNEYGRPRDVVGESRTVFTSHSDAAFDVCVENYFTSCKPPLAPLTINHD